MSKTLELLDSYKKASGIKSDNAAALALGVTRSSVSAWRHGKNRPDPETVESMARAAGLNPARWVPLIEAERAHSPAARATWLRLAGAACLCFTLLTPTQSRASESAQLSTITHRLCICESLAMGAEPSFQAQLLSVGEQFHIILG